MLATATMSDLPKDSMNFFQLTCDYEERKSAVGRLGFVKRGGRPSDKAVLTSPHRPTAKAAVPQRDAERNAGHNNSLLDGA